MEEWKKYNITDVCDTISDTYKDGASKVVLINTSDVLEGKVTNHEFVPNKNLAGQFKKKFRKDDILYSEIRPANRRYAYVDFEPKDYIASTKLMVLRSKPCILPKYLYYLLTNSTTIRNLHTIAVGRSGTFPQITYSELANIKFKLPSLDEQEEILSTLLSIDDKIAVNCRICENLEQQAQALFKHWFIDFAPFKNGKFVESELGMIPEGWRVGSLFDIADVHDSKRKPLSGMQRTKMEKIYPYYGATEQMDMVDDYIFDGRYVLMGEDGSVVRDNGLPFIQYVWGKIWVNNHAHVLSGKNGFTTEMLIPFLTKYNIRGLVTGAVQAKLNQANMARISLAIPPQSILDKISGLFEIFYDTYRQCVTERRTLATLRDALLPKLMSGELKVNETKY